MVSEPQDSVLAPGSYLIVDPQQAFDNVEYQLFKNHVDRIQPLLDLTPHGFASGLMHGSVPNTQYLWFATGPGVFQDNYLRCYATSQFLCCVPIAMLAHLDFALLEPIWFGTEVSWSFEENRIEIGSIKIEVPRCGC